MPGFLPGGSAQAGGGYGADWSSALYGGMYPGASGGGYESPSMWGMQMPSFADRYGDWGYNPGTPSMYTSQPYQNSWGELFNPQIPQGYQGLFGANNPGGALPLGGAGGYNAPIPGWSDIDNSGNRNWTDPDLFHIIPGGG